MVNWTEHHGGPAPFPQGTPISVRYRDGATVSTEVGHWRAKDWAHDGSSRDIVAYLCSYSEALDKMSLQVETKVKTGGSTPNQYRISLNLPTTEDRTKFVQVDLEAMDVIDALDLSGNLKDVQKALFRLDKKADVSVQYDLTKSVFYLVRELKKRGYISHAKFWEISDYISKALKGE